MKYLIKDLSKMTGLTPARIRKWQERYKILKPETLDNGYHYYDNNDLFVLKRIANELEKNIPLSKILALGRDKLLEPVSQEGFSADELKKIQIIASGKYRTLEVELNRLHKEQSFSSWVKSSLHPLIVLTGKGWERGYISVADEHAFSRWFYSYFSEHIKKFKDKESKSFDWLVVVYPEDEHEIGALLHYGELLSKGVSARFCGRLPEDELIKELYSGNYRFLTISAVVPRKVSEFESLKKRIQDRFENIKIVFGGYGYRKKIEG